MIPSRTFADRDFEYLGMIELERGEDGEICGFMPQANYRDVSTTALHTYGAGPFCRFRIARNRRDGGLYVFTLDDFPVYAGECAKSAKGGAQTAMVAFRRATAFRAGSPPTVGRMQPSLQRHFEVVALIFGSRLLMDRAMRGLRPRRRWYMAVIQPEIGQSGTAVGFARSWQDANEAARGARLAIADPYSGVRFINGYVIHLLRPKILRGTMATSTSIP
jgi:hypothetical protein